MKKISCRLVWFFISIIINLLPVDHAWCQTNPFDEMFKSITALELQVKIIMKDDARSSSTAEREYSELRDKLDVTIEGTYTYKAYDLSVTPPPGWPPGVPYIPPLPTYPRGPLLVPDKKSATINGSGGGDSYHWWLFEHCKDDTLICQDFKQEGTQTWQYGTVNSFYEDQDQFKLVRDLLVKQESENAPVRYTFDLRPVGIDNYVKGSGSGTTTLRSFDGEQSSSYTIEEYGASLGRSWTEFVDQNGNSKITGDLTIENGRATASGHIVHSYEYTSPDGDLETGTAEVFYMIRAILSTDQPPDQSELGCPDGKCKGSGGTSAPGAEYGAPTWSVNMANLNIFITDTPLWYRSPIGPPVEITLSYNSKAPETQFEPVGRKWQLNYESFLSSDQATGDVTIYMPDGKRDVYTYTPTGFTAPYRVFNDLKITRQGGLFDGNDYILTFPDGTVYVYKVPEWSYRWAFLTEIRDPHGKSLKLNWEGLFPFGGKLTQITDAMSRTTVFTQDEYNRISIISDSFGRAASFGYDLLGRLTSITDMGGYVTTFTYAEGVLADDFSVIRRMVQGSNTWDFILDGSSLTVTDNMGTEKFVLNAEQGTASYQGASAVSGESYGYTLAPAPDGSKHKDVTGLQSPEKVSFDFTYDAKGNLMTDTLKAATGDETVTLTYNAKGKVTSVQDAMKSVNAFTTLTYYANNVDLKELRNGLGPITAEYNDKHDITLLTNRLGDATTFDYNEFGQLVKKTDNIGQTVFVYDDNSHQLTRIERAGAVVGKYGYDNIGRVNSYTDADGFTTTYTYNDLDDLLRITYPDETFMEFGYSITIPHQLDSMTDQARRKTSYTYNAHKQLQKILLDDPEGWNTGFAYYPAGNLKQLIDPNGKMTQFEYNKDGRLTKKIFADDPPNSFTYTNGRLTQFTNARGINTDYTYDKNGNVLTIVYSDSTPSVTMEYDDYNRLIRIEDGLGVHLMTYDANSRIKYIDGPWENDTLTFDYDARGRKISVTIEKGLTVSYSYDDLDRLTTVTGNGLTYSYVYQGSTTLMEELIRPDYSRTEYAYDSVMKRLERYTNRDRTGGVLSEHTFAYDALGQPTSETVTNGPTLQFINLGEEVYTYNNLNQVVTLNGLGDAFAYDLDGNMTKSLTGDGRPFEAIYDAGNRLTSIEYSDGAGIVRRQEYVYGADSFLGIQKSYANGALTGEKRFIRDGGLVLQERSGANNAERDYVWGIAKPGGVGDLLALVQGGQTYQYYFNTRGDVTAVLNSAGEVAAAYAYDPFGVPLAAVGTLNQPMRFSTKPYDEGTGLYYYGFRFYSPILGSWITRDPKGERGGLNLYEFVGNNPVNWIDPFGLDSVVESNKMLKEAVEKYRGEHEVKEPTSSRNPYGFLGCKEVRKLYKSKFKEWGDWFQRKKTVWTSGDPKNGMEALKDIPFKTPVKMGHPADYGELGQKYLEYGEKRINDEIKTETGE